MSWKKWFWAEGTSTQHKWLIVLMLAVFLGCLPVIFLRDFVPSPLMQRAGLVIAAAIMVLIALWMRRMYLAGSWKPGEPWTSASRTKRWLMTPLCTLFFLAILWINVAVTLPMAYTRVMGVEAQALSQVETYRSTGSRSGCRYQFKVKEINFMFFEFCLERDDYESLPSHPMPAELQFRETALGREVTSLRLLPLSSALPEGVSIEDGIMTRITVGD